MKLEKGMIVSIDDLCWYVVVEVHYSANDKLTYLSCICDHANNIHRLSASDIDTYMTLEEIGNYAWSGYEIETREIPEYLRERDIPFQVITEVLAGRHDARFNHWS